MVNKIVKSQKEVLTMEDIRWSSPFIHTIPFFLFQKHFTEINNVYWSYVPAANTIEKKAIESLKEETADPREFFLIPDIDDRRLDNTYAEWKNHFRLFGNYTRLNMIMLLSSCFETYLRSVVSLAIESKPASILGCPDRIDGLFLLKTQNGYGEVNNKEYLFSSIIDDICRGEWSKRAECYKRYFLSFPSNVDLKKLDELRVKRNSIGHFFARKKEEYEITISPQSVSPIQVSANKLKEYFKLIHTTATEIDKHLHSDYIGSYDIIKYFYYHMRKNDLTNKSPRVLARELRKQLGSLGLQTPGQEYYERLMEYFSFNNEACIFRYNRKACVRIINDRIKNVTLKENGRECSFSLFHFRLFSKRYRFQANKDFSEKHSYENGEVFFYSDRLIDFIVDKILDQPDTIIDCLKRNE